MKQGQVNTLVILGGNPVYNAPADLDFKALAAKRQDRGSPGLLRG